MGFHGNSVLVGFPPLEPGFLDESGMCITSCWCVCVFVCVSFFFSVFVCGFVCVFVCVCVFECVLGGGGSATHRVLIEGPDGKRVWPLKPAEVEGNLSAAPHQHSGREQTSSDCQSP